MNMWSPLESMSAAPVPISMYFSLEGPEQMLGTGSENHLQGLQKCGGAAQGQGVDRASPRFTPCVMHASFCLRSFKMEMFFKLGVFIHMLLREKCF